MKKDKRNSKAEEIAIKNTLNLIVSMYYGGGWWLVFLAASYLAHFDIVYPLCIISVVGRSFMAFGRDTKSARVDSSDSSRSRKCTRALDVLLNYTRACSSDSRPLRLSSSDAISICCHRGCLVCMHSALPGGRRHHTGLMLPPRRLSVGQYDHFLSPHGVARSPRYQNNNADDSSIPFVVIVLFGDLG